jgi:GMP synthase-like glutamine amidotransferase
MKIHILQHVPFEDNGSIRAWLESRHADVTYTRFFESGALPKIDDLNLLIILGGPMSANDEAILQWLGPEKAFIREAVQREIPTIGICLGAQLIASALGARVYRNAQKEIGWFSVDATPSPSGSFCFPERFLAFHWHGETFNLPPGAVLLASSEGCDNQAFQIGRHIIGLQFHLETTPESLRELVTNCRDELVPGTYIQTEEEMRRVPKSTYENINNLMNGLLTYVAGSK